MAHSFGHHHEYWHFRSSMKRIVINQLTCLRSINNDTVRLEQNSCHHNLSGLRVPTWYPPDMNKSFTASVECPTNHPKVQIYLIPCTVYHISPVSLTYIYEFIQSNECRSAWRGLSPQLEYAIHNIPKSFLRQAAKCECPRCPRMPRLPCLKNQVLSH